MRKRKLLPTAKRAFANSFAAEASYLISIPIVHLIRQFGYVSDIPNLTDTRKIPKLNGLPTVFIFIGAN